MAPLVYNGLLFGGLAVLVALEARGEGFRRGAFDRVDGARPRRNWAFLIAALAAGSTVQHIGAALPKVLPALIDWSGHPLLELLACFLVAELVGWGLHYVKHVHPWLWRFHFSHHRETHYDVWLVTHTHGLEVVISGTLMSALLVLAGFTAPAVQVYLLFYSLANTYQHSGFDLTLGWLDKVIVNPAYHRYHHAVGSRTNYGNTLTVWDVVFRTAQWPADHRAPDVEIGLGDGPEPYGFWAELGYFAAPEAPAVAPAPESAA
jgi:sterol desaturase/sphingolipid hydroxylase (fatty acid hydroxylase superfamily)